MSKSGSRYGRRSNWFKIHCLLQEQQQQQQASQNGCQKASPLSPNSLNLMRHPSYSTSIFSRPPCTKEELMMLKLDEYGKHPVAAASPSISSPDSHNSDSSIEIGEKRNPLLNISSNKHLPNSNTQSQQSPMAFNKDLFLPLPFAGFPLMPPPGFLPPPTHFLFSSYHNALYEQNHHLLQQQVQQGLLKTTEMSQTVSSDKESKQQSHKRHYSDTLYDTKIPKNVDNEDEEIDMEDNESDEVLTPPRSPKSPKSSDHNNPIDLSMKSGSSTKSDDINHNYYTKAKTNSKSDNLCVNGGSIDGGLNEYRENDNRKTIHCHIVKDSAQMNGGYGEGDDDDVKYDEYEIELKRRKLHMTAPLDLTTKV
jgi:nuclear receptor subfamily 0 group A